MALFPLAELAQQPTPFYYYDLGLLGRTLAAVKAAVGASPIHVHYALKANANPDVLAPIVAAGLGADCVSLGEVRAALAAGFPASKIFFAGVGKTDAEIDYALNARIGCFNVESMAELEVLAAMAASKSVVAPVALRVNPNIDAHTHHYITTGLQENKFGIDLSMLPEAVAYCQRQPSLRLRGLHFHIGSQITALEPYRLLCERVNAIVADYAARGVAFDIINLGGGLGVDYDDPDRHPVADFQALFDIFRAHLRLAPGQQLHCEPGRSIVAQCGSLITRVVYVKQGVGKKFVIVDAGMSDLIRPALYQAHHKIENITAAATAERGECATAERGEEMERYDVVGPICESSDCFGTDELLPATRRGDLLALRTAGAYGEVMAMHYNMRPLPASLCR